MDMEKIHSPGEDCPEDTPETREAFKEIPSDAAAEPQMTSLEAPSELAPAEQEFPSAIDFQDLAQENGQYPEFPSSDTVFFSPVNNGPTPNNDATQVLPSAEELQGMLAGGEPVQNSLAGGDLQGTLYDAPDTEEDPLSGLEALLGEDTPAEEGAEDADADDGDLSLEELTPEELQDIKKQIRKERRAARRKRLNKEEEKPKTDTFLRKLWFVLRLGDGLFGIPQIFAALIWLVLVFAIGTSLGRTLWLCASDVLALGKTPHEITITIDANDDLPAIAEKLHDAGLIRYPGLFLKFADITDKGDNIIKETSITFGNDHVYDYNALINALSFKGGSVITLEVTIPEGYSCAQIFELLEKKGVCTVSALENYCAEGGPYSYWFLQEIPEQFRKHKYGLEGFLFPDTYEFYMDDEPERVIEKFLDNFNAKFTQRMIDKFIAMLNKTELDLSLYEVIIMASMVEKEKAVDLEGYTIASVFYNRLRKPSVYPTLDSDATINYAIDYYNKGELITDEQINASPYHTYKHAGLPPTPIANPGLASLDAALEPYSAEAPMDHYYFFLLNRDTNRHEFSRTLDEHKEKEKRLGYT